MARQTLGLRCGRLFRRNEGQEKDLLPWSPVGGKKGIAREKRDMQEKKRLKYEKPVSIDMGRVAPILGDTCSVGNGAADCPAGMNNAVVAVCSPAGSDADNDCRTGSSAGTFCWPTGTSAQVYCLAGSGYGVSTRSFSPDIQSDSLGGAGTLGGDSGTITPETSPTDTPLN